jgi:ribonuclease P protein component
MVGRIRRRATFRTLSRPDGRAQSGGVSVVFINDGPEATAMPVVGYAIGRGHGGAVERNRLKRRLRAAVRASQADLPVGAYLFRARPGAVDLGFAELCRAVRAAALAAAEMADGRDRRPR